MLSERSGSELVFSVLRALMTAYQFWGPESRLELSALCAIIGASDHDVRGALIFLTQEGLVAHDQATDTARLTVNGARNLLGPPGQ